jgi:hypothetical protein
LHRDARGTHNDLVDDCPAASERIARLLRDALAGLGGFFQQRQICLHVPVAGILRLRG